MSNGYFVCVGYKDPLGKKYNSLYACLFRKCCILVRVDATHPSSTTTSSTPSDPNFSMHKSWRGYQGGPGCVYTWTTHPTAHQADEARVMSVLCAARTLTKTSRLQLPLRFKLLNLKAKEQRESYDRANRMVENTTIRSYRRIKPISRDFSHAPSCHPQKLVL